MVVNTQYMTPNLASRCVSSGDSATKRGCFSLSHRCVPNVPPNTGVAAFSTSFGPPNVGTF